MNIPSILQIPSPFHPLPIPEAEEAGVEVYIKRDDLIHPFVSGNKWRKLIGFLEEAKKLQADILVSYGGYYSNHLLALAAAGDLIGNKTKGVVRGEQPAKEGLVIKLCRTLGMTLEFSSRKDFKLMKRSLSGILSSQGEYFIPEGGYGIQGLEGFEALREELPFIPDHIITATGTGTTLAGLSKALAEENAVVHGIVVLKGMESLPGEIEALLKSTSHSPYQLHTEYHHGGYAKTSEELHAFISSFIRLHGIMIDPVYSGKMMYATVELLKAGYFSKGSKIVCLHTGGVIGGLSLF